MIFLLIIVMIIGIYGLIGNQYSALRKMDHMQNTLEEIRDLLRTK